METINDNLYKFKKYTYKLSQDKDNKIYQEKYKYYKKLLSSQSTLSEEHTQMYGGTAEENNSYLLHGTNLYYIDDIKKTGLDGKYNKKILDIIKKYWADVAYLSRDPYVIYFLDRQENINDKGPINISFTGQAAVAKEYSEGRRKFGEGPSVFLNLFDKYIKEQGITDESVISDFKLIDKASRYPGIILAINVEDFKDRIEFARLNIPSDLKKWEYVLRFAIPPGKIYIRRNKNDYVLLLSADGDKYIQELKKKFELEQAEIEKHIMAQVPRPHLNEPIKQEWNIETREGPIYFSYKTINKTKNMIIEIIYDIYDDKDYLTLYITDYNKININCDIIKQMPTYRINLRYQTGIELLSPEIINKLIEAIKWMLNYIRIDDRTQYFNNILTIFSNFKNVYDALIDLQLNLPCDILS